MTTSMPRGKESVRFPLVSVIILNHNGLTYLKTRLRECLDSVVTCKYPSLEIIFVDNGSTDGSSAFVQKSYGDKVVVIENEDNLGCARGFNTGIKSSRGEYIAMISNDMVVDSNWLTRIVKLMQADQRIGLAACKRMRYGTENIIDLIGGDLYLCGRMKNIGMGEIDQGQYDKNMYDFDFVGGTQIVRRRAIEEVGWFDPGFSPFYSEDVDLCYRMRKAGYKVVYVFDAIVWHMGSATFQGLAHYTPTRVFIGYMMQRNRIRLNLIHFRIRRLLSAFLIDSIWFVVDPNCIRKRLLFRAYAWNLIHIAVTLTRRRAIGPSPPYDCKYGTHLSLLPALRNGKVDHV